MRFRYKDEMNFRVAIALLLILSVAIAAAITFQKKLPPYDEKRESATIRRELEANYDILERAFLTGKTDEADTILHYDIDVYDSINQALNDPTRQSGGDYQNDIEDRTAVGSVAFGEGVAERFKVSRKIRSLTSGRRFASACVELTYSGTLPDTEGQFGPKGKDIKLELIALYNDVWNFTDDSEEKLIWQLLIRENLALTLKINGKAVEIEPSGNRQN